MNHTEDTTKVKELISILKSMPKRLQNNRVYQAYTTLSAQLLLAKASGLALNTNPIPRM